MAQTSSSKALEIAHLIRNRLTSIILCAHALQTDWAPKLSAEQERELRIIQSSVEEIKRVLDMLTNSYCTEVLTLKKAAIRRRIYRFAAPGRGRD